MAPQKMSRVGRISKFEDKIIEMKSGEQKSKTINTTKLINIYILRVQEVVVLCSVVSFLIAHMLGFWVILILSQKLYQNQHFLFIFSVSVSGEALITYWQDSCNRLFLVLLYSSLTTIPGLCHLYWFAPWLYFSHFEISRLTKVQAPRLEMNLINLG